LGVRTTGEEEPVFPDIVVIDQPENEVVMTAEVEVPGSVTREAARDWVLFSQKFKTAFYLYVPVGYAEEARRIAKETGARLTGLRTWRETPYGVEVNEV
jgi:intergrase/recombinase